MLGNPRASEKEAFDLVCAELKKDQGYWGAIFSYWFANNYKQFYVEENGEHSVTFVHRQSERQVRTGERETINELKRNIKSALMDHTLSNGKELRDASFGDCAKEGGWFLAISKCGKANEIVGKKLTETDLKNLQKRFEKCIA
jgi:hypothetical protein